MSVKNDLNLTINKSTENLENKINSSLDGINQRAKDFLEFELFQTIVFWTAIIGLMFFVFNEGLKVYDIILPKLALKIFYPSLLFIPFLIYIISKIVHRIKWGYWE